jgi:hypothetical protein
MQRPGIWEEGWLKFPGASLLKKMLENYPKKVLLLFQQKFPFLFKGS